MMTKDDIKTVDTFIESNAVHIVKEAWKEIKSAMCEANSNAVLADVQALLDVIDGYVDELDMPNIKLKAKKVAEHVA